MSLLDEVEAKLARRLDADEVAMVARLEAAGRDVEFIVTTISGETPPAPPERVVKFEPMGIEHVRNITDMEVKTDEEKAE